MWINKLHLIRCGMSSKQASRAISMLNRSCPSKELPLMVELRQRGQQLLTKHFDLDYAIKVSKEREASTHQKVIIGEWKELRTVLERIKATIIDFTRYRGESFGELQSMYAIDRTEAIRQYAEYKAKG